MSKKIFKLALCLFLIMLVLPTFGCKGAIKSAVKGKIGREVAQEATSSAVGYVLDQNDTADSKKSGSQNTGRTKTASKTGAIAAGVAATSAIATADAATENKRPSFHLGKGSNELSFGSISIGMSQTGMYALLLPSNLKVDGEFTRYPLPDLEVVTCNDSVVALVSNSSNVETKRGIRQGDSVQAVIKAYGTPDLESEYNGSTLYEYKFSDSDNRNCLLRFAIKNQRVDYISMRVIE